MPRFAVILTLTYSQTVRTRKGIMSGKDLQKVSKTITELALWQMEKDSETHGHASIVNLRFREIKPKAAPAKPKSPRRQKP